MTAQPSEVFSDIMELEIADGLKELLIDYGFTCEKTTSLFGITCVLHEELYLVLFTIIHMDESGDQSDEQQAAEKPIGIEEQKTIEGQEAQAAEEESTEIVNEPRAKTTEEIIGKAQQENKASVKQIVNDKPKPKLKDPSMKLFDQFTKHFRISKLANGTTNNTLKQIQKQLTQMEKTNIIRNKQQLVIGQLVTQMKGNAKAIRQG